MYFKLDGDNYRIKLLTTGYLKKLYFATKKQRENYELDPSRYGVHWEDLDEDLSFKGLIRDAEKVNITERKKSKLKNHLRISCMVRYDKYKNLHS